MMERFTQKKMGHGNVLMLTPDDEYWSVAKNQGGFVIKGDAIDRLAYYEDMEEQGRLVVLPCKVGDLMWGIRRFGTNRKVQQAPVTAMNFLDDMTLSIALGKVCSGEYGKKIFSTREDAERALKEGADHE